MAEKWLKKMAMGGSQLSASSAQARLAAREALKLGYREKH